MEPERSSLPAETLELAARHGLSLVSEISFNEMGLDYRVAFTRDVQGKRWVLRIPRRAELFSKIQHEARILNLVKQRLPVQVPDWQICTGELIAYPMLVDPVALTFDEKTYAVTWNIDQHSQAYVESLGALLVALHATSASDAVDAGLSHSSAEQARESVLGDIERVKSEIGIGADLELTLRKWLDDDKLWPAFSVLVHGDLYAGHVTADASSRITGVIDWSEAEVSDPSIDFAGHLAVFGEESLEKLVAVYARLGGRTWSSMIEHVKGRQAASPVKYGIFALGSRREEHLAAARIQLGVTSD